MSSGVLFTFDCVFEGGCARADCTSTQIAPPSSYIP